jgi:hypothetical protein
MGLVAAAFVASAGSPLGLLDSLLDLKQLVPVFAWLAFGLT